MADMAKRFGIILFPAFRDRLQPIRSRLNLVQVISAIVFALVLSHLLQVELYATTSDESTGRPNIVFILADDLGYRELGSFGQKRIQTPHLDQLARQGMRLTQHYSGNAVCAPSRCVLMTGKHPGHAYIRSNKARSRFPPAKSRWRN